MPVTNDRTPSSMQARAFIEALLHPEPSARLGAAQHAAACSRVPGPPKAAGSVLLEHCWLHR